VEALVWVFLPRPELSENPKVWMFARRNLMKALLALPALGFLKLVFGYLGSIPEGKAPEFEEFDLTKPQGSEEPILGNQGLAWLVRDKKGSYALLNRCSHLGCPVRFVPLESSFSCPCHGSEYDLGGRVLKGPAIRPLERLKLFRVGEARLKAGLTIEVGPEFRL
jgi:nitrite reductase/ring-hydroxylating ferredoxin subunit